MQQQDETLYEANNCTTNEEDEPRKKQIRFSMNNIVGTLTKLKKVLKRVFNKKVLIGAGAAAVIFICVIVGFQYAANNYMTPIRSTERIENQQFVNMKKYVKNSFKNIGAKNAGEIVNILYKSDDFLDGMDVAQEFFEEDYESRLEKYGDDFKVSYVINDKIKLEKANLRSYQKEFRQNVKYIEEMLGDVKDYTSSDWGDFADVMGLTRAQAKKLANALTEMFDDIGRLEVTDGYELDVVKR